MTDPDNLQWAISGLFALFIAILILGLSYNNSNKNQTDCLQGVVNERIEYRVKVDSSKYEMRQDYLITCSENHQMRVTSDRNFPIGSTISKQWILSSP